MRGTIGTSIVSLFLWLLAPSLTVTGQAAARSFVVNFNKEVYSGGNQNWSVAIDSAGIVYFGNNKGLLSYDGANWKHYSMPDNMVVRSVAVGQGQRIYVGAFEEFGYFRPNLSGGMNYISLSSPPGNTSFHNDEIWRILVFRGKTYFQSFSHIYVYDGTSVNVIDPGGTIVLLMEARQRLFVHKVGEGLFEIRNDSLQLVPGSERFANDEIKAILPYGKNDFLVGAASGGLYVMNSNGFTPLDKPVNKRIREAEINNGIALDSFLIIGTIVDGIYILDPDGSLHQHLNTENFLQNNTVLALREGKGRSFWAGLDRGIDYVNLETPLAFYIDPSLNRRAVYDAAMTGDTLWVGTNQGLFRYKYDPSSGYSRPRLVEGTQGQVWDLQVIDGKLYCGHTNGTYLIRNGIPVRISDINGGYSIKQVDSKGKKILLQSSYSVFSVFTRQGDEWLFSHAVPGFYEPIPHFERDHLGYIWASHANKGLYRLKFDTEFKQIESARYFGQKNGLPTEHHIGVANVDNRVVFSTNNKIYTYNDLSDSIVPYEWLNKQLGEYEASGRIVEAGNGRYWFVTGDKIGLFHIENGKVNPLFTYDLSLQGATFGSGQPGISKLNDHLFLLCLDNGFAIYDLADTSGGQYKEVLRPLIREVLTYNRKNERKILPVSEKPELPWNSRNIEFVFSPDQISVSPLFSYRMKGLDNQWSDWTKRSTANFTRLPAGEYRFEVRTMQTNGTPGVPAMFSFRINRPWYASLTALVIYGILLISVLLVLRIMIVQRVRKHTSRMQALEKEKRRRDRIIAEQDMVRLRNEKLHAEVSHKNIQLANYTMTILKKNELLIKLKDEIISQKRDLGGRYPNYHFDRLVGMIDSNISSEDDWQVFEMHFDQAHENFFKRLKNAYDELTPSDLKLCAYLRLNLSSKEIAPLLNITVRGVEIRRYRLRKRLTLNTEENLVEFLMNF